MTKTSDAHLLADSELAGLHPQAPAPDEAQRLRQVLPPHRPQLAIELYSVVK